MGFSSFIKAIPVLTFTVKTDAVQLAVSANCILLLTLEGGEVSGYHTAGDFMYKYTS